MEVQGDLAFCEALMAGGDVFDLLLGAVLVGGIDAGHQPDAHGVPDVFGLRLLGAGRLVPGHRAVRLAVAGPERLEILRLQDRGERGSGRGSVRVEWVERGG